MNGVRNRRRARGKSIRKDIDTGEKGRTEYVVGWVEGTILQRLMHVDQSDAKNKVVTIYCWRRDGQLTSVFKLLMEILRGDLRSG